MKEIIELQRRIVPEILVTLEKRYNILRNIHILQPVGRRTLAHKLSMGERIVRAEVDFLKGQNLVDINPLGMTITQDGEYIIDELKEFIHIARGITNVEEKLKRKLGIQGVIVVPGNIEENDYVQGDIGRATARLIEKLVQDQSILGVTGGTTMAAVAENITQYTKPRNITVVPARGGLGKEVKYQANTIVAEIAGKFKGNYRLLYASDTLGEKAVESILQDPEIKKVIDIIKSVDLLVFGIGRADHMAKRRGMDREVLEKLESLAAVSEAFGYYFNRRGEIVHETKTIGIDYEDFKKVPYAIGVAGGSQKAEAILAITSLKKEMTLVTDEAAAKKILENE